MPGVGPVCAQPCLTGRTEAQTGSELQESYVPVRNPLRMLSYYRCNNREILSARAQKSWFDYLITTNLELILVSFFFNLFIYSLIYLFTEAIFIVSVT